MIGTGSSVVRRFPPLSELPAFRYNRNQGGFLRIKSSWKLSYDIVFYNNLTPPMSVINEISTYTYKYWITEAKFRPFQLWARGRLFSIKQILYYGKSCVINWFCRAVFDKWKKAIAFHVFKFSQVFVWKFINKIYLQMQIVRDYSLYLVMCQALATNGLQERIRNPRVLHGVFWDTVKFKCTHFKAYYSVSRKIFNCTSHVQIWCSSLIFLSQLSQSWS